MLERRGSGEETLHTNTQTEIKLSIRKFYSVPDDAETFCNKIESL